MNLLSILATQIFSIMKYALIVAFICGFCNLSDGQGWVKTYGGSGDDRSNVLELSSDGGYILVGFSSVSDTSEDGDLLIMKTDSNGDSLWSKCWSRGPDVDEGFDVKKTSDNGYIITGVTWTGLNEWLYLLKTDSNGDTLWTKNYRSGVSYAYGLGVQQLSDDGYAVCGGGNGDFYILRTDNLGDTLWTKRILIADYGEAASLVVAPNGDFVITGYQDVSPGSNKNIFIARIDSLGTIIWMKLYGGPYFDNSKDIQNTSDGNFIIAGEWSFFSGSVYTTYATLLKIDPLGDTLWVKRYDCLPTGLRLNSLKQTSDGGYILLGTDFVAATGDQDMFLVKTNAVGDTIWTHRYIVNGYVNGNSVIQTGDGGYVMTGRTWIYPYAEQCVLIKVDGDGNIISVITSAQNQIEKQKPALVPNYIKPGQELKIQLESFEKVKVVFTDIKGNVVEEIMENTNVNFLLKKISTKGVYLYQIYSCEKLISKGKLVVY